MIAPQLQSVFVFVRDLDRALFFYCGTLGLPLRQRWPGGAEVGGAGMGITLAVADEDTAPEAIGRPTGLTFAIDGATARNLARRGLFRAEPVRYPWGTFAVVADPDGNEFAFLAPVAAEPTPEPAPIPVTHATFRPRQRSG
jgi:catechol 2,3-dioxygenase-like lactoylglutathione lyase family enzyme